MLRALVLALVLANLVYLVWVKGLLAPYGFAPASQAEPERLEQQIRPEAVELLDPRAAQPGALAPASAAAPAATASAPALEPSAPASAPSAPASGPAAPGAAASSPAAAVAAKAGAVASATPKSTDASPDVGVIPVAANKSDSERKSDAETRKDESDAPSQCLQAGLFTEAQASAMRPRLQASLPAGSWTFANSTTKPVRWIVYMGKYVSKEALNKKRALLEQAEVDYETPASPQLNPGLSLGSYKTRAQAEAALAKLTARGIRSAKVVPERPELPTQWLRLPAASASLQAKAKTLIPQISGKPLKACD